MDAFELTKLASIIWLVLDWLIRIIALFVVPRNRTPTAGMAWLLFIFLIPTVGMIAFMLLGSPKLPSSRRHAQKTINEAIRNVTKSQTKQQRGNIQVPHSRAHLAKLSEELSALPVVGHNSVEVLTLYNETIAAIAADIDEAKSFVYLEYYVIALDETTEPIFDALKRAGERGVDCRVMYDWYATRKFKSYAAMLERLRSDGLKTQAMLKFKLPTKGYVRPDLRNHRKLAIIDGRVGYTGSQNLVQRDYHRKDDIVYDELIMRVQGPAVVEMYAVFVTDWFAETKQLIKKDDRSIKNILVDKQGETAAQVLPSGPGYENENNLKLFTSLLYSAKKSILIVNPYFVPDDSLMSALTSASIRGIDVTVVNSEAMDQWMVGHAQRSFYETLLKAGIKIHLYKAPTLLHSKFIVVDNDIAVVGSSNLDIRSFFLNSEVTFIAYDSNVAKELNDVAGLYLAKSKQITLIRWQKRPMRLVLIDNVARLTASLQ